MLGSRCSSPDEPEENLIANVFSKIEIKNRPGERA
jgi:hypothetical protein